MPRHLNIDPSPSRANEPYHRAHRSVPPMATSRAPHGHINRTPRPAPSDTFQAPEPGRQRRSPVNHAPIVSPVASAAKGRRSLIERLDIDAPASSVPPISTGELRATSSTNKRWQIKDADGQWPQLALRRRGRYDGRGLNKAKLATNGRYLLAEAQRLLDAGGVIEAEALILHGFTRYYHTAHVPLAAKMLVLCNKDSASRLVDGATSLQQLGHVLTPYMATAFVKALTDLGAHQEAWSVYEKCRKDTPEYHRALSVAALKTAYFLGGDELEAVMGDLARARPSKSETMMLLTCVMAFQSAPMTNAVFCSMVENGIDLTISSYIQVFNFQKDRGMPEAWDHVLQAIDKRPKHLSRGLHRALLSQHIIANDWVAGWQVFAAVEARPRATNACDREKLALALVEAGLDVQAERVMVALQQSCHVSSIGRIIAAQIQRDANMYGIDAARMAFERANAFWVQEQPEVISALMVAYRATGQSRAGLAYFCKKRYPAVCRADYERLMLDFKREIVNQRDEKTVEGLLDA